MNRNATSILLTIFTICATLLGAAMILMGLLTLGKIYAPVSSKHKTTGAIINEYEVDYKGNPKLAVEYTYNLDGYVFKGQSYVNKSYKKKVGDKITVYYSKGNDFDTTILGYNPTPYVVVTVFGFFIFAFGVGGIFQRMGLNNALYYKSSYKPSIQDLENNMAWKEKIKSTRADEDARNEVFMNALRTGNLNIENRSNRDS